LRIENIAIKDQIIKILDETIIALKNSKQITSYVEKMNFEIKNLKNLIKEIIFSEGKIIEIKIPNLNEGNSGIRNQKELLDHHKNDQVNIQDLEV